MCRVSSATKSSSIGLKKSLNLTILRLLNLERLVSRVGFGIDTKFQRFEKWVTNEKCRQLIYATILRIWMGGAGGNGKGEYCSQNGGKLVCSSARARGETHLKKQRLIKLLRGCEALGPRTQVKGPYGKKDREARPHTRGRRRPKELRQRDSDLGKPCQGDTWNHPALSEAEGRVICFEQ